MQVALDDGLYYTQMRLHRLECSVDRVVVVLDSQRSLRIMSSPPFRAQMRRDLTFTSSPMAAKTAFPGANGCNAKEVSKVPSISHEHAATHDTNGLSDDAGQRSDHLGDGAKTMK